MQFKTLHPSHLMDHKLFDFKSVNSDSGVLMAVILLLISHRNSCCAAGVAIEPDDQLEIIELS